MDRRLRLDVVNGEADVVLVDNSGWDFAGNDLGKNRAHGDGEVLDKINRIGKGREPCKGNPPATGETADTPPTCIFSSKPGQGARVGSCLSSCSASRRASVNKS